MPDFETFLLALASIALIVVAFGFSWAVISGLWWLICMLIGWQFSFGVCPAGCSDLQAEIQHAGKPCKHHAGHRPDV